MPIFGDDLNELMNAKSNYPMVLFFLFRQYKIYQMTKNKIFILNKLMHLLLQEKS